MIDDDAVALSNLQRQVIHGTPDVGLAENRQRGARHRAAQPARQGRQRIAERLTAANALALISQYDLVADGSDNFATRYLVSDACYFARKPLVTAAVGVFDGTLTTIRAHERGKDGKPNPTYRCLFPEPPPPGTVPACSEAGILGALTGVLGSMMALEAIREIVGFGEGLVGRLLMVDARAMRFETLSYGWDADNPLSGRQPDHHGFVGAPGEGDDRCVLLCFDSESGSPPSRAAAHAQSIAQGKPIHIIVGFAAGGATDIVARVLGAKLSESLGQQVVVENRTGAGGTIATEVVARADAGRHHAADDAARQRSQRDAVRQDPARAVRRPNSPRSRLGGADRQRAGGASVTTT